MNKVSKILASGALIAGSLGIGSLDYQRRERDKIEHVRQDTLKHLFGVALTLRSNNDSSPEKWDQFYRKAAEQGVDEITANTTIDAIISAIKVENGEQK